MSETPDYADDLLTPLNKRIACLIRDHVFGDISEAGKQELDQWLNEKEEHKLIFEEATDKEKLVSNLHFLEESDVTQKLERIKQKLHFNQPRPVIKLWHWAAAASFIIVAGVSLYFLNTRKNGQAVADVLPGTHKAKLVLSDGNNINLSQSGDSLLALQDKIVVRKKDGELVTYETKSNTGINTIITPRGGSWNVTLSDGTKLWINAASSVSFPTSFTGNQRRISISGEVYFEVAKNPSMPFIVDVAGKATSVEVLGTHFNINAYPDEKTTKITLLEGSVKVTDPSHDISILKPAEEASISEAGQTKLTKMADTSTATAWKNELTQFTRVDLNVVMRQISRWYDVEVVYKQKLPGSSFNGSIRRNTNLSEVVATLNMNEIPAKIENGKLVIGK